ncbi:putative quinone-oxidoreductase, chloroplastic [Monoraphidium neglectum]|uniref:Putative quinone-oxidoreductase, chloroplastic n=1 Tax=Monoraphidium neglectum TaxID=145388 RepID=A0A0D2MQR7_9CHLO|nr:putative quinone-oxidoreductase, chloroplastic [Monoraphidium neglectum]KIZ04980.1 putative quinone-oxidoreductase, chloroplastic [Monoraphidium neglectum]|eukprot:XP_013903999.1 putative quinone-oxidoreductase, chloroplastic [Monoraphidium neglectum]
MPKAVQIYEIGGTEVLKLEEVDLPKKGASEVLIKTRSIGVNPVDIRILGGDVAGVVEEGDEAGKFKPGDKVFALTPGYYNSTAAGTYAEYVVADPAWLAKVPDNLPLEEAAGLPLAALTGWQALQKANPKAGQRVLVTAASGGVGHIVVQVAKALGLFVVGIAGPKNLDFVKSLGADEVVDYTTQDVADLYSAPDKQFDIAIDCMGTRSQLLQKLLSVTKPTGFFSHIHNAGTDNEVLDAAKAAHAAGKGPAVAATLVQPNGAQLQEIADLVAAGKVKLEVALSLPLEDAAKAHDQVATGHTRGKVVLTV